MNLLTGANESLSKLTLFLCLLIPTVLTDPITHKGLFRDHTHNNPTADGNDSNGHVELCHTNGTSSCSDLNAYCDNGKCRCKEGYFLNKFAVSCQRIQILHQACTGNEECQAWDPEAFCDASLTSFHVPVCDCKPGYLYSRRENSCLPCSINIAHERSVGHGEQIALKSCSTAQHHDQSDPLRLRTPLRVILSAMTLITILIVLYFFCYRLLEDFKSLISKRHRTLTLAQLSHANLVRCNGGVQGEGIHSNFAFGTTGSRSSNNANAIANSPTPTFLTSSLQDFHFGASSITPTEFGTQCPSSASSITYQLPRFSGNQIFIDQLTPLPNTSVALLRAAMRGFDNPSAIPPFDPPPRYEEAVVSNNPTSPSRDNSRRPSRAEQS